MVGQVGIRKQCICSEIGSDGTHSCYPPMRPHRHRMRLNNSAFGVGEIMACDNHKQHYLNKGWTLVMELCGHCCTNAASVDGTCESCLDKITAPTGGEAYRLKAMESGHCPNRDYIVGCCYYANAPEKYCTFCLAQNIMSPADAEKYKMGKRRPQGRETSRAAAKFITGSIRACVLTPSCAGNMTASVLVTEDSKGPVLWWACKVCGVSQRALKTGTVVAPSTLAPLLAKVDAYGPVPVNAELAEQMEHMRNIIHESESE
jgi:hypothetical protein